MYIAYQLCSSNSAGLPGYMSSTKKIKHPPSSQKRGHGWYAVVICNIFGLIVRSPVAFLCQSMSLFFDFTCSVWCLHGLGPTPSLTTEMDALGIIHIHLDFSLCWRKRQKSLSSSMHSFMFWQVLFSLDLQLEAIINIFDVECWIMNIQFPLMATTLQPHVSATFLNIPAPSNRWIKTFHESLVLSAYISLILHSSN